MQLEAALRSLQAYRVEALWLWLASIVLLAVIQATLAWMGKDRAGEFAKLLGTLPTLVVMGLPPLAALVAGLHLMRENREAEGIALFLLAPLFAVFAAAKFKRLLVWVLTGLGTAGRPSAAPRHRDAALAGGERPALDGRPLDQPTPPRR